MPRAEKKPGKPRPDFPLFPHQNGFWAKKVRGKFAYFGKVADDPRGQAALLRWLDEKDDLLAGRIPRGKSGETTVRDVIDGFLEAKERQVQAGDIIQRTFDEYLIVGTALADSLGRDRPVDNLEPADFERFRTSLAKRLGPTALGVWVGKVRTIFHYADEAGIIDRLPKFGPHFKAPAKKVVRAAREAKGERLFTPDEIKAMLAKAPVNLKAMILLGINCGYGNHDCAALPFSAIDFDAGWLAFPRPKNGIKRRCPLWPETVEGLRAAIAKRKPPADPAHAQYVFIGQMRLPYVRDHDSASLGDKFTTFSKKIGTYRPGLSFYALRHTFETIGGDSRDQVAVNYIMGHADGTMAAVYREKVFDERLHAVVAHVRKWLWG